MSESSTAAVGLVLAPEFGERVSALAQQMPVWVISSAVNDHAIDVARAAVTGGRVTKLLARDGESPDNLLRRAIYAIDEHHDGESGGTPYRCLLVYGAVCIPSDELLADFGFASVTAMDDGFRVEK